VGGYFSDAISATGANTKNRRRPRVSGFVPTLRDANPEFKRWGFFLAPAPFRLFLASLLPCLLASAPNPTRNNPTFKNRRNFLTTNEKTFSTRNKNTSSGSPDLRHESRATGRGPLPRLRDTNNLEFLIPRE
jgi:hypothetical protein